MNKYCKLAAVFVGMIAAAVIEVIVLPSPYCFICSVISGGFAGYCAGNIRDGKW